MTGGIDPRVRQRVLTGGRVRSTDELAISSPFVAVDDGMAAPAANPEHTAVLVRCRIPQTLADLSHETCAPVGVLRVIVLDLIDSGHLDLTHRPGIEPPHRDVSLLLEALDGIAKL